MIRSNITRALLAATLALGAAIAVPAMSQPLDSEAVYNHYYFDANDDQIGSASDYCSAWGIQRTGPIPPTGTAYTVTEIYGYCRRGDLTPI